MLLQIALTIDSLFRLGALKDEEEEEEEGTAEEMGGRVKEEEGTTVGVPGATKEERHDHGDCYDGGGPAGGIASMHAGAAGSNAGMVSVPLIPHIALKAHT